MGPEIAAAVGLIAAVFAVWLARNVHIKGWGSLQALFPGYGHREGQKFIFSTISIQPKSFIPFAAKYSFCSSVTVTSDGIQVYAPFPFHSPFFISWASITSADLRNYFLGGEKLVLKVKGFDGNLFFFFGPAKEIFKKWSSRKVANA